MISPCTKFSYFKKKTILKTILKQKISEKMIFSYIFCLLLEINWKQLKEKLENCVFFDKTQNHDLFFFTKTEKHRFGNELKIIQTWPPDVKKIELNLPAHFCNLLKSVYFKKPVTRISFLSKCCHFQYNFVLISEKMTTFWKKWDSRNWLLKMNGL